ncbi:hypothetical protein ACFQVC_21595 [Streptomyces monticola]|uniref:ATP/GTP-binding protein n=1 Tax=Streptomyces monticola TaxID=2666263 RepID=A0ABW2JMZ6_9ACTN
MGDGMGIMPRFDGEEAEPPDRGDGENGGEDPPQVSVKEVAQHAVEQLELPQPDIRLSPDEDESQVVHFPTWMWLSQTSWKPVTETAEVTGVSVTATARPQRTVWSMGDGRQVVCKGRGTAFSTEYAADAMSPDCGHIYRRSSAGSPGDAYTLTATLVWDVTWEGEGEQGAVPGLQTTSERKVTVSEVQAVVVR